MQVCVLLEPRDSLRQIQWYQNNGAFSSSRTFFFLQVGGGGASPVNHIPKQIKKKVQGHWQSHNTRGGGIFQLSRLQRELTTFNNTSAPALLWACTRGRQRTFCPSHPLKDYIKLTCLWAVWCKLTGKTQISFGAQQKSSSFERPYPFEMQSA